MHEEAAQSSEVITPPQALQPQPPHNLVESTHTPSMPLDANAPSNTPSINVPLDSPESMESPESMAHDSTLLDSAPLDSSAFTQNLTQNIVAQTHTTSHNTSSPHAEHAYFGVFILLILSFVAFNYTLKIQRFISRKLAKKRGNKLKIAPYECGPVPIKQPARVSHHFFIIALLFVLFDIEVVFMIPWAIVYKDFVQNHLGAFVLIEMISFVALLVIGLVYAWKKGALQWQNMD